MHLIEVLAALLCITVYSSFMCPNIVHLYEIIRNTSVLKNEVSRDFFITESFRRTCINNPNSADITARFTSFKELCCSMWEFKEFSVGFENEPLSLSSSQVLQSEKPLGRLCRAFWQTGSGNCSVLCREVNE